MLHWLQFKYLQLKNVSVAHTPACTFSLVLHWLQCRERGRPPLGPPGDHPRRTQTHPRFTSDAPKLFRVRVGGLGMKDVGLLGLGFEGEV